MLKQLIRIGVVAVWAITLISCGSRPQASAQPDPDIGAEVALKFINQYTGYLENSFPNMQGATGMLQWVESHPSASKNLKRVLKEILDEAEKQAPGFGLGFDPILDAQDFPNDGFVLEDMDTATGFLTVVSPSWAEFKIRMKVEWQQGKWWVDGVGIVNIPEGEQSPR